MGDNESKLKIQSAIKDFSVKPLTEASINLFNTLGYNTQRQNPLDEKTYSFFKESFLFSTSGFNESKAMVSEWKSIDLLFQLTGAELAGQAGLFDTGKVKWKGDDKESVIETYLFFALELANDGYSRSALARITREINKVFPMPVMILFRCGETLTLSVINRRLSKKDAGNTLPGLDFDIGGATVNFNKQTGLVSNIIFDEETPDAEKFIKICTDVFKTDFFNALSEYIRKEKKEAGIVQRLMNIPIADAKEVHKILAGK